MELLGWILSWLPDGLIVMIAYLLMIIGLGLYAASKFLPSLIFGLQKLPAELLGILAIVISAYLFGGHNTEMVWQARVTELEAKVKIAEEQSAKANTVIKEKIVYRTKVVKEVQVKIQESIVEVATKIDAVCRVDPAVISILNQAAETPGSKPK